MKKTLLTLLGFYCLLTISNAQIDFIQLTKQIGSTLKSVDIGDLNSDGLNDIVAATGFDYGDTCNYKLYLYYQNSQNTLNTPLILNYPSFFFGLNALHIEDLNNDGRNDILIAFDDSLGIFYCEPDGKFAPIKTFYSGSNIDGVNTGDLNNDTLTDIAVSHLGSNFIKVFYQNINGSFTTKSYPFAKSLNNDIEVNDVNSDGLNDLIFMPGQTTSGTLIVFYQDSTLGITDDIDTLEYVFGSSRIFSDVGSGDLNNDGKMDVVGSIGGNIAEIVLLCQDSTNHIFNNPVSVPAYDIPSTIKINDLNCDGNNEIIVGHDGWKSVTVYEKDSSGVFNEYQIFDASMYFNNNSMAVGDINGDNRKDVVTVSNSEMKILTNTTKPKIYDKTEKTVMNLVIVTDTLENKSSCQNTVNDTVNGCIYERTDTFEITERTIQKRYLGDSVLVKSGELCGRLYFDTLQIIPFDFVAESFVLIDTVTNPGSPGLISCEQSNSINEIAQNTIIAYPNPVKDEIFIEFPKIERVVGTIRIFDVTGSEVFYVPFENSGNQHFNISQLKKGIYILQINTTGNLSSTKFVKD